MLVPMYPAHISRHASRVSRIRENTSQQPRPAAHIEHVQQNPGVAVGSCAPAARVIPAALKTIKIIDSNDSISRITKKVSQMNLFILSSRLRAVNGEIERLRDTLPFRQTFLVITSAHYNRYRLHKPNFVLETKNISLSLYLSISPRTSKSLDVDSLPASLRLAQSENTPPVWA